MNIEKKIVTSEDLKKSGFKLHYFVSDIAGISKKYREKNETEIEKIVIFRDKLKPTNIISDDYFFNEVEDKVKEMISNAIKEKVKDQIDYLEDIVSKYEKDILNRASISKIIRLIRNKINGYNEINAIEEIKARIEKFKKIYSSDLNLEYHFSDEEKNKTYIVPDNYEELVNGTEVYCSYFNMGEKNGILKYRLAKMEIDSKNFYSPFLVDINVENKGQYYLNFEAEGFYSEGENKGQKRCYISYDKENLNYELTNRYSGHKIFDTVEKALEHNLSVIQKMKDKAEGDAKLIIENV